MADDFLVNLMGNAMRARALRVLALSQNTAFTVAQLAKRAGLTEVAALKELKALERAGLARRGKFSIAVRGLGGRRVSSGKQKQETWSFNKEAQYATALSRFIHEISPTKHDAIVNKLRRTGRLAAVVLSGSFVGDPTRPADLILALDNYDEGRLEQAVRTLEPIYGTEIRYAVFTTPELRYRLTIHDRLLRDTLDYPHLVLMDKTRLL